MVETGSPAQDPGSWVLVPDPTRLQGSLVQRKEVLPGGSPGTSRPFETHVSNLCGVLLLDGHAWDTFVRDTSNPQPSPLHSEVQQKAYRMEGKTVPGQEHFQAGCFHPQAGNTLVPVLEDEDHCPTFPGTDVLGTLERRVSQDRSRTFRDLDRSSSLSGWCCCGVFALLRRACPPLRPLVNVLKGQWVESRRAPFSGHWWVFSSAPNSCVVEVPPLRRMTVVQKNLGTSPASLSITSPPPPPSGTLASCAAASGVSGTAESSTGDGSKIASYLVPQLFLAGKWIHGDRM